MHTPVEFIADSPGKPRKKAAIEMFIYNPNLGPLSKYQREMQENPRLKERFGQYLSVGVYFDNEEQVLKYYSYNQRHNNPPQTIKIYPSLESLVANLPEEQNDVLKNKPKLFIIAHGNGGMYGLSGDHYGKEGLDDSEKMMGNRFDKIIDNFKQATPNLKERVVTLEGCNVANRQQGQENPDFNNQSFLENLSKNHPDIIFCGSAPWNPKDNLTGVRAQVNLPITSMTGSVWKSGNWVVFHDDGLQVVAKKSVFATTQSAKEVKLNTIKYATESLKQTKVNLEDTESILKNIALSPDCLTINDLNKISGFPREIPINDTMESCIQQEKKLLQQEKDIYIARVNNILAKVENGEKITQRDILIIALVLKNSTVFDGGNEELKEKILSQKALLQSVMVTCGKILIAGPDNDQLIDLLVSRGIDINTPDEYGKTALHYAAHYFYFYNVDGREREPLQLIRKLIDMGANLEAKDKEGCTPIMLAAEFKHPAVVQVLKDHGAEMEEQAVASLETVNSTSESKSSDEVHPPSADSATLDLSVRKPTAANQYKDELQKMKREDPESKDPESNDPESKDPERKDPEIDSKSMKL